MTQESFKSGFVSIIVISLIWPFRLVKMTGMFGEQSSEITCLHAPHGDTGPGVSAATASILNDFSPSE